jgi:hypothetical protein
MPTSWEQICAQFSLPVATLCHVRCVRACRAPAHSILVLPQVSSISLLREPKWLSSIYLNASPQARKNTLDTLDQISPHIPTNSLIGGDFNCVANPLLDIHRRDPQATTLMTIPDNGKPSPLAKDGATPTASYTNKRKGITQDIPPTYTPALIELYPQRSIPMESQHTLRITLYFYRRLILRPPPRPPPNRTHPRPYLH